MTIKERISDDATRALKAGEKDRVGCLRMLKSKMLEREVALRPTKGAGYALDDDEAIGVLSTYAKQRRESIESYRQGGREDLAAKEAAELAIIETYLPQPLSEEQITEIVLRAIDETGASSPRDMGQVMKRVMAETRGAADGKLVSRIVKERLAGQGA